MLNLNYNNLIFSIVKDKGDFFKTNLPEIGKIRSMVESIKLLLNIPPNRIDIYVAEGKRVYKIVMKSPDIHKTILGNFSYLPLDDRIDLYTSENLMIPFIQWKNKKPIFKSYSMFLDRVGVDKLFDRVIKLS